MGHGEVDKVETPTRALRLNLSGIAATPQNTQDRRCCLLLCVVVVVVSVSSGGLGGCLPRLNSRPRTDDEGICNREMNSKLVKTKAREKKWKKE